ncbi:hypothetical protein [Sphingomonas sp. BK580]|uniref:hypothetical protein n=1 Tax=Sphingomonas sp. BK580 TaxID=2586972 RepID=UPI00160DA0BC|nr:hypothetical protein [Sphingomonas sp. BK580]MBB3695582.1 hypothetical protein [Sphingomonas sp. BK580]
MLRDISAVHEASNWLGFNSNPDADGGYRTGTLGMIGDFAESAGGIVAERFTTAIFALRVDE